VIPYVACGLPLAVRLVAICYTPFTFAVTLLIYENTKRPRCTKETARKPEISQFRRILNKDLQTFLQAVA